MANIYRPAPFLLLVLFSSISHSHTQTRDFFFSFPFPFSLFPFSFLFFPFVLFCSAFFSSSLLNSWSVSSYQSFYQIESSIIQKQALSICIQSSIPILAPFPTHSSTHCFALSYTSSPTNLLVIQTKTGEKSCVSTSLSPSWS